MMKGQGVYCPTLPDVVCCARKGRWLFLYRFLKRHPALCECIKASTLIPSNTVALDDFSDCFVFIKSV